MERTELPIMLCFGAGFSLLFLGVYLNFVGQGARLEAFGDLFFVFGGALFGVVPFLIERVSAEVTECPDCGYKMKV